MRTSVKHAKEPLVFDLSFTCSCWMSSCMWTSFHQCYVPEHHNLLQHMMNMCWFPTSNLVCCTNGMDRPRKNSYLVMSIPVQHWMNSWSCWDNVFSLRITKGKLAFSLLLNFPYKLKKMRRNNLGMNLFEGSRECWKS